MRLEKPKSKFRRVHVTATDGRTRKSKGMTVYDTTPEGVLESLKRMVAGAAAEPLGEAGVKKEAAAEPSAA